MKRKADGSHHHSSNLIINYEVQPTESSQGMGDKWAKSNSVEMCETNGTAHLNGNLTPNEMFEGEEDRLVSNLANKSCKAKNTACAARDAASAALDVVHSVSNGKLSQSRLWNNLVVVLFHNKTNLLLPFGPAAAVAAALNMKQGWVFLFSLLGIAPLAERLGFLTEELAYYTGPTVGGLLNATFGNATELIISIHALRNGMIHVVKQSLLGSILSNMLLVLGCAFLCGGISNKKIQSFNKATASVNSGLLLMAVMSLLFPTVLHYTHTELHKGQSEITLSRFSSGVMLVAYAFYLFFQLKGHSEIYCSEETQGHDVEDTKEEEPETAELTFWESIIWLAVVTAFISCLSSYLVNAIEGTSENWNMPVAFISVILLPIVGNAAEHASAIMFAMKDQLDISLGVAIGSSTQISMFLIPFCVMVGWVISRPMDLNFQLFETATLFMSVLVVAFMLQEGKSNYFKGLMLVLCYLIVAASFFVHVDNTAADGD